MGYDSMAFGRSYSFSIYPNNLLPSQKISPMKYLKLNILFFLFIPSIILAQTEKVDTTVMNQIRKEGLQNSKVMDIAFHLTDARGYFGKG
jgi:hypothetical protein